MEVPGGRPLRSTDRTGGGQLPVRRVDAPGLLSRGARPHQGRVCARQRRTGSATCRHCRCRSRRPPRRSPRHAPRALPGGRLPDRLGTSTNMNMNEVLAHLANRGARRRPGPLTRRCTQRPRQPRAVLQRRDPRRAAPRLGACLRERVRRRRKRSRPSSAGSRRSTAELTLGRTHLMDAVPTTLRRVFGAWADRLEAAVAPAAPPRTRSWRCPWAARHVGDRHRGRHAAVWRARSSAGRVHKARAEAARQPRRGDCRPGRPGRIRGRAGRARGACSSRSRTTCAPALGPFGEPGRARASRRATRLGPSCRGRSTR